MTRPTSDGDETDDADDDLEDPVLRMVAAAPSISLGSAFMVALRGVLYGASPWTARSTHAWADGTTRRGLVDDPDERHGESEDPVPRKTPRP
jgi:hypothetical protein